jgi:hypothetical protein
MRRGSWCLLLGVLLLGLVAAITIACIAPTEVRGADAPATEFSAVRARAHLEAIARTPHPVGSPAHEDVRAYVLEVLGGLGLEVRVQDTSAALKAAAVIHAARVQNVIARLPGTRPGPAVMLVAHYDSVPQSRGASDDGAGVATLLETARALVAGPRLDSDVLFLVSDAEEIAMCGALAFTEEELASHPVGVALNFEARGTRGAVALYDTSEKNGELVRAISSAAPRVVSSSLLASLSRLLPNDSDASILKRAAIPTYAFAFVDHLYQYHQSTDSLDALDLRSVQHEGDYALPLARYLGSHPLPLPPSSAVTYFDVLGRTVVSYSTLVARALALLTLAGFVALVARARREGAVTLPGVAAGCALACAALAVSGLAAGLVHVALRAAIEPFVLFATPGLAAYAGLALGAGALLLVYDRSVRKGRVASASLGAMSLWAVALALTAAFVPAASFALQWPLLFAVGGAALWMRHRQAPPWWTGGAVAALLVPASFFWSYIAYAVFVMVGPNAPEAVAVTSATPLLLALPLLALTGEPVVRRVAAGAASLSLVVAVAWGLSVRRSPGLPRPDSLVYLVERARHSARWTTTDPKHDAFVTQRIPGSRQTVRADYRDLPPLLTVAHAVDEGPLRHGTLTVASPRRARCVDFWEASHEPVSETRVNGKKVVEIVRFSPELDEKLVRLWTGGARQSDWVMEYCGADETGFRLDLFSPAGRPVKLRIHETSDGLPDPPPVPRVPSEAYPAADSDVTTVQVDVTL